MSDFRLTAHGDDRRPVLRVFFNPTADFESVYSGNQDVEDEQVGMAASDLDQSAYTIQGSRDLVDALPIEEALENLDDVVLVLDDQDLELFRCQSRRYGNVVSARESQQIFTPDAPVSPRGAVGRQQILFDPVDDRNAGLPAGAY